MTNGHSPRRHRVLLAGLLLTSLALRVPGLHQSIWEDELWSTRIKLGTGPLYLGTILRDVHPPFYSSFMFLWIRLFGDSEISIRMPALLFGLGSIALLFHFARRHAGEAVAFSAAFFLALSPVHVWYSQEARAYSALLFFLLLLAVSYVELGRPDARRRWTVLYAVSLAALVLTHFFMAAFALLVQALAWVERNPHRRRLLAIHAVALSLVGIWFLIEWKQDVLGSTVGLLLPFNHQALWHQFGNWFLLGRPWDPTTYAPGTRALQALALLLLLRGLVRLARGRDAARPLRLVPLFLLTLPAVLLALTLAGFEPYIERALYPSLTFYALALAVGSVDWRRPALRRTGVVFLVGLSLFAQVHFRLHRDEWTVYKPKPDWRAAAGYLVREAAAGPAPFTLFACIPPHPLTYYDERFRDVWFGIVEGHDVLRGPDAQRYLGIYYLDPGRVENVAATLAANGGTRFHFIIDRTWPGSADRVLALLRADPRYRLVGTRCFFKVEVYTFELAGEGTGTAEGTTGPPPAPGS